jgi:hypothetical protein
MKQLLPDQQILVSSLVAQLRVIEGIRAIVLGGSHARGRAQTGSDIDLGILYSEGAPFSIECVRQVADGVNDTTNPVVTGFYEWGPWVNGGAWLTIGGRRVDLIYRSLEHVERVVDEAEAGRYELHYLQQPPFGFFSGTYLGEIEVCVPLFDPGSVIAPLKERVAVYPVALRETVVRDFLFMAEFTLATFAPKFASRGDAYGTAACLARGVNELILALFALNRKHLLNDKTALVETTEFEFAPLDFALRVQQTLASLGSSAVELGAAVASIVQLFRETIPLAQGLYQPRFVLPK